MVQANVKGAQRPYEQFSYLPFKTWGGYSFDLSPPYYSFYYTVSQPVGERGATTPCTAVPNGRLPGRQGGIACTPAHTRLLAFVMQVPDSLGCDGVKARCILQW